VLAGAAYGIPLYGTMAHSFVQAHDDEAGAFIDFARAFPRSTVFLVDTYDTLEGVRKVAALAPRLKREGIAVKGVRLDSGDLAALAKEARAILDAAGLKDTTVFASGNLDEYRLTELVSAGAPIDGFGVGTSLVISSDAPALDVVYKLQEYAARPRRKRSEGKATWPGRKQVYRRRGADGRFDCDVVALADDERPGEPLLRQVMKAGRRIASPESLETMRQRAARELAALPESIRSLEPAQGPYRVEIAPGIKTLADELDRAHNELAAAS
jgi:nicotinate phosphoribosyltransferase